MRRYRKGLALFLAAALVLGQSGLSAAQPSEKNLQTEGESKEEGGNKSSSEKESKEEGGSRPSSEEESKEEEGGSRPSSEEESKEEDGSRPSSEEESKEEDGSRPSSEEESKEEDGSRPSLEAETLPQEEDLPWIEFQPLAMSSYSFEEKPDLQELFLQFPTRLKAVDEEGTALSIPVYEWECEEDYERTELAEYLFYPEIDRKKWEFEEEALPSILVSLEEAEKEMELVGYGAGLKVTVTADAGVLPAGTKLRVLPVKQEARLEELRSSIEESESETGDSRKVEELIVLDLTLWKDGEEIQPDTKKGEIHVSFERMDRSASGTLENAAVYHAGDGENSSNLEKEDAVAGEDYVSCSVEHFSEFAVVLLGDRFVGNGPYLVKNGGTVRDRLYETMHEALTASRENGTATIQLQRDAQEKRDVEINKSVTIDLNGHTLSGSLTIVPHPHENPGVAIVGGSGEDGNVIDGTLKVNGGGILTMDSCKMNGPITMDGDKLTMTDCSVTYAGNGDSAIQVNSASELNLTDTSVTYEGAKTTGGAVCISGAGSIAMEGCTIQNLSSAGIYFRKDLDVITIGNCRIEGCQIEAGGQNMEAIWIDTLSAGNQITIENSKVSAPNGYAVSTGWKLDKDATITLGGGNTFDGRIRVTGNTDPAYRYRFLVTGGQFNYDKPDVFVNGNKVGGQAELKNRLSLTGGEFKADVNDFVGSGYECVQNPSGGEYPYAVVPSTGSGPVFTLGASGKTYYESLAAAIAANGGETIYLGEEVTLGNENLSGITLQCASGGALLYGGTLEEFLAKGAKTEVIAITCAGERFDNITSEGGKLQGGSGFTADNYSRYTALLDSGYLFRPDDHYRICQESEVQAKIGSLGYFYFGNAVDAALANDTAGSRVKDEVVLLKPVTQTALIDSDYGSLTIDLNGNTLTGNVSGCGVLIEASHVDVTLKNGSVHGKNFGVVTNGAQTDVTLTVEGVDVSSDETAYYLPADGTAAITGGSASGKTGIEVRAGRVTVTDTQISGNGSFSEAPNDNGATTWGVGVAVVQHTTKHPIQVTLKNCQVNGTENALRQRDLQGNRLDNVSLSVEGGTYLAAGGQAVYSENGLGFIKAGIFSSEPDPAYLAENCEVTERDGKYWVREKAVSGGLQDGKAELSVPESVLPQPEVPQELPAEQHQEYHEQFETAKDSVKDMAQNTAVVGNAASVDNLAAAAAANGIVDTSIKAQISLSQELKEAEFETIVEKDEAGAVTGVQVLPKTLVFEVTASSVELNEAGQPIWGSEKPLDLSQAAMGGRKTRFYFRLPVPASVTAAYANVQHEGDPLVQYRIQGSGIGKYITVSAWHLSQFTVTFTNERMETSGSDSGGSSRGDSFRNPYAGIWKRDEIGWWFVKSDGTYPVNCWHQCIWNGELHWYHFNAHGYLDAGWFTDTDGQIYFLHDLHDNRFGFMYKGWNWVNGKCYYFSEKAMENGIKEGALLRNTVTPDGYTVDGTGAWTVNGIVQTR
mgnify:FL=1